MNQLTPVEPIARGLYLAGPTRRLLLGVLWVYVAVTLVDPFDQLFHIKTPLFLLVVAIWIARIVFGYTSAGRFPGLIAVACFGLAIPFAATLIGLLNGRIPLAARGFNTVEIFSLLFLALVVASERIDLSYILIRLCVLVAFITLAIGATALFSPILYVGLFQFVAAKQLAYLAIDTDRFGIGIGSFYYKTSATMVLPLAYYAARLVRQRPHRIRTGILVLIYFTALVLSGSRANALAALAILGFFAIVKFRSAFGLPAATILSIAVLSSASILILPRVLNPAERSNAVKVAHWHSYVSEFELHPSYLIWGEGADTEFYSAGFQSNTTITELTYMEMIRNFGIPITLLFIFALLWPALALVRSVARGSGFLYLVLAYLTYLIMSASNPLLLSTSGMLFVDAVWGNVLATRHCGTFPSALA